MSIAQELADNEAVSGTFDLSIEILVDNHKLTRAQRVAYVQLAMNVLAETRIKAALLLPGVAEVSGTVRSSVNGTFTFDPDPEGFIE